MLLGPFLCPRTGNASNLLISLISLACLILLFLPKLSIFLNWRNSLSEPLAGTCGSLSRPLSAPARAGAAMGHESEARSVTRQSQQFDNIQRDSVWRLWQVVTLVLQTFLLEILFQVDLLLLDRDYYGICWK